MTTISTHVLDTSRGVPGAGITVTLETLGKKIATGITDGEGRLRFDASVPPGSCTLHFAVRAYFALRTQDSLYDDVMISIRVLPSAPHYHIPLLLSPFGYSTYRGT